MSLLDDAKAYDAQSKGRANQPITDEVIDLVFAWLKGDIKDIALRNVLAKRNSNVYSTQSYPTIARALREAYRQGRLTIRD